MIPSFRLSRTAFDGVAAGLGTGRTLFLLRSARISVNLLLLRAMLERCPPDLRVAAGLDPALAVLRAVQASDPTAVRGLAAQPAFGAWVRHCLRRLGGDPATADLRCDLAYLGAVAAAGAIHTGLSCELTVPVRRGGAMVPGLGMVAVPDDSGATTVRLSGERGGMLLTTPAGRIRVPHRRSAADRCRWQPVRRIAARHRGQRLRLAIDDVGPYRCYPGLELADRLAEDTVGGWRRRCGDAWRILVRQYPAMAAGVGVLVRSVVPLVPVAGHQRAATGADSIGAFAMSLPDDPVMFADSLVHETQHTKLTALLDLWPLFRGDDGARFPAPWRPDPRPFSGLLHGAYAFLGVAGFWRARRRMVRGAAAEAADVQFGLWRRRVAEAIDTVRDAGLLTPVGRGFVAVMAQVVAGWSTERVPRRATLLAEDVVLADRVRWRIRNLAPDPAYRERLVTEWLAGRPGSVSGGRGDVAPGTLVPTPYATAAAAYVAGRYDAARAAYRDAVAARPEATDGWVGLALAVRRAGTGPTTLVDRPELVRDVYRGLTDRAEGRSRAVDPVALGEWLADRLDAIDHYGWRYPYLEGDAGGHHLREPLTTSITRE